MTLLNFTKDCDIFTFINSLKTYLNSNPSKKDITILTRTIKTKYTKFINSYLKTYPKYQNIIIYPENKYYLIIGFYLNNYPEIPLLDILKNVIKKYQNEFSRKLGNHINLETSLELINKADKEYKFLKILKNKNKVFHIFNFPNISKISTSDTYYINYLNDYNYVLEIYAKKKEDTTLNEYAIFAYCLGRIINWCLVKDPLEAPYGFYRFLKKENLTLLINSKEELPSVFGDIFASVLLKNTPYEDNTIPYNKNFKTYILKEINMYLNKDSFKKSHVSLISPQELCPCGSNMTYQNCCQKKDFKWLKENGTYIKETPLDDESIMALKELESIKEKELNRYVYASEKILSESILPDITILKHIKQLRACGIPEDLLYGLYKTNIFVTEFNKDKISDIELLEWEEAVNEYHEITKKDSPQHLSILTSIKIGNELLDTFWQNNYSVCATLINSFVANFSDKYYDFSNFKITTINEFLIFCARKLSLTYHSFCTSIENDDEIGAKSLLRTLYEILINIITYQKNPLLFKNKIIPLSKLSMGEYEYLKTTNGFISSSKVVNPKTKEIYLVKTTIDELSKASGESYYNLYKTLFNDLSLYVHLNVTSVNEFFKEPNPFYELDSVSLTSLIGIFIMIVAISNLSQIDAISTLLYRDMTYVTDEIKKDMEALITFIKNIDTSNSLYDIILNIISDYNTIK